MINRFLPVALCAVAACELTPQTSRIDRSYNEARKSGLVAVRPYPTPADVCQVIGENALTVDYLDHTATFVGCPAHETGAIAARKAEGAEQVDHIGAWVLLSVPN